jgi:hypothetical protein
MIKYLFSKNGIFADRAYLQTKASIMFLKEYRNKKELLKPFSANLL